MEPLKTHNTPPKNNEIEAFSLFFGALNVFLEVPLVRKNGEPIDPYKVLGGNISLITKASNGNNFVVNVDEKVIYQQNFQTNPDSAYFTYTGDCTLFKELVEGYTKTSILDMNIFGMKGGESKEKYFDFEYEWKNDGHLALELFTMLGEQDSFEIKHIESESFSNSNTVIYTFDSSLKGAVTPPPYKVGKGKNHFRFTLKSPSMIPANSRAGLLNLKVVEYEEMYSKSLDWEFEDKMENTSKWNILKGTETVTEGSIAYFTDNDIDSELGIYRDGIKFDITVKTKVRISEDTDKAQIKIGNGTFAHIIEISPVEPLKTLNTASKTMKLNRFHCF